MASEAITYDKAELRSIIKSFKAMEDEAIAEAKETSSALADFVKGNIIAATTNSYNRLDNRIAEGARVSKSSKVGEISFGFSGQKLSGGGTTQQLWGGAEFGSRKFKQFPTWSGKRGWFIYPTLKNLQPQIIKQWEESFSKIVRKFE